MRHILATLLTGVVFYTAALADDLRRPNAEELVDRLKPPPEPALTKGYVPNKGVTVEGASAPLSRPSVDLDVTFEFNSAKLTTDAALLLDHLGRALRDPALAASKFQVIGHTDGVGSDSYNRVLSEKRAASVRNYLTARHGIDANRLETVGYGRSRLLDNAHPESAINRRVQVINVGE
ncbi:MAG: OmpA family protein [Alphaproteobacteria bacterium]|nr:OmpA family protein [Alphaproteobacteria bacterium]